MSQSFKVKCALCRPLSWQNQNWTAIQQHQWANVVFLNDALLLQELQVHSVRQMTWYVSSFIRREQFGLSLFPGLQTFQSYVSWAASLKHTVGQSRCRQLLSGSGTCCQERFCSWQAATSWQSGGGGSRQAHLLEVETTWSNLKLYQYNSYCCVATYLLLHPC